MVKSDTGRIRLLTVLPLGQPRGADAGTGLLLGVIVREFLHLNVLVHVQVTEGLLCVACWPPNLQGHDPRGFPYSDVLLEWRRPKRASRVHVAEDVPPLVSLIFDG